MRTLVIVAATLLLSSPALAQSTTSKQGQSNQQVQQNPPANPQTNATPQLTAKIAQQIRSNLEQAGFKDIKLMPSSFIVRAQDQNNNTVVMVINPESVEAITESNKDNSMDRGTVGQGSTTPSNSDSSGGAMKQPRR